MNELRLRFRDADQADLPLGAGTHVLGRLPTGLGPVDAGQPWLLRICNDRRGIWMTVAEGLRGVHVNGRPVQQVAMLRAGDCIHADGDELLLAAAGENRLPIPPATTNRDPIGNLRLVLRGIGGNHHGRCISLETPRRIGSAADTDLRIDGPGIASLHAVIEARNGQAVLRDTAAEVMVNGRPMREGVLRSGDQIVFDAQHRFVLEGPSSASVLPMQRAPSLIADDADAPPSPPPPRSWTQRVPWLLISAILLAIALSALLLFGAR
ncbi:MAG: FHA domain-containing protein [Thermomonas sp.]|uniref:FHA domain-containing protein n=1 Tax=Thermomonas sp. TaxID=1971895 RepID=UPI0039E4C1C0